MTESFYESPDSELGRDRKIASGSDINSVFHSELSIKKIFLFAAVTTLAIMLIWIGTLIAIILVIFAIDEGLLDTMSDGMAIFLLLGPAFPSTFICTFVALTIIRSRIAKRVS